MLLRLWVIILIFSIGYPLWGHRQKGIFRAFTLVDRIIVSESREIQIRVEAELLFASNVDAVAEAISDNYAGIRSCLLRTTLPGTLP